MSDEKRRKARSDYVHRRMLQSTIAAAHGVSEATVGRWKKAAKEAGDDWDKARTAHVIAANGVDALVAARHSFAGAAVEPDPFAVADDPAAFAAARLKKKPDAGPAASPCLLF